METFDKLFGGLLVFIYTTVVTALSSTGI